MFKKNTTSLIGRFLFLTLCLPLICSLPQAQAELRKVKINQTLPEFTLHDVDGDDFSFKHGQSKVLVLAFLSNNQPQSLNALEDIQNVTESLGRETKDFSFLIVVNDATIEGPLETLHKNPKPNVHILIDADYKLWGLLGIVANPTTIVTGKEDKILWVQAGYGYDYRSALRHHLAIAEGFEKAQQQNENTSVKTLLAESVQAKVDRHRQMSKILESKGHFESAIAQLQKALDLDPNSIATKLDLAELNCRIGRSQAALQVTSKINPQENTDQARLAFIRGWAYRQTGRLDLAEKYLLQAIQLDPKSSRVLFELGKMYQAKGQDDKALEAYYKALALIYPDSKNQQFLINNN